MMPNVLDTFVIELGLDPAKFTEGEKTALAAFKKTGDEAIKIGKEIEAQSAKSTAFFSTLKREALSMLGIFLAGRGIKEFVTFITDLDASTSRLARTFNMSVREVSAWSGALEQNGGQASSATSAISGLTGEMNKFMLTGQASFLPVLNRLGIGLFDSNKNLKTAGELFLEISDAIKGMDPARAAAFLSMIPGMNQDMINLLIQGRAAVEGYLKAARDAGGTTDESAAASREYQRNLSLLERTATSTSRALLTLLMPAMIGIMGAFRNAIQEGPTHGKPFWEWFFTPPTFEVIPGGLADRVLKWLMPGEGDKSLRGLWGAITAPAPVGKNEPAGSPAYTSSEQEAYIRKAAIARGIDPDVAVSVARSEGLNQYVGDRGTSFGPFQLHYKNNIPGLSNAGLGDKFTKQTGLDARDPSTWKSQVDFALDEAKKGGWGAWHGWKGLPYQGIAPIAPGPGVTNSQQSSSSSTSSSVSVGMVNVYTNETTAAGIARDIKPALERTSFAAAANYGQQG